MYFWHTRGVDYLRKHFDLAETGLSEAQVRENRDKHGSNVLPELPPTPGWVIFLRQFQSPLIYVLFGAAAVIFLIQEWTDALIILFVLLFNAVVGTIQEGKAQNTLASLKKFAETKAVVLRNSIEEIIPDSEVVPGDALILREGDKVPADARIINSASLAVDEAALTGESEPVYKKTDVLKLVNLPVADQKNMVFKGTHVIAGSGQAIVVATGAATVIGTISRKIASIQSEDPLKRDVRNLSRLIIIAVAAISAALFIVGISVGRPLKEMFVTVVSLSVSIIPEGLPIVLTLVLATGVWRMSKRNALVKKLQAVESLGQAQIIAVDKTGTITKNELVVQKVCLGNQFFNVSGTGYEPRGDITLNNEIIEPSKFPGLWRLAKAAGLSGSAQVMFNEDRQIWQVAGDPTEAALQVLAEKMGLRKVELELDFPRLAELPFSSQTKYHAVLHQTDKTNTLTVVGAPEMIMELSTNLWQEQRNSQFGPEQKKDMENHIKEMTSQGLRVVGLAVKNLAADALSPEDVVGLTFLGLVGMKDALRPEVKDSLARARAAGLRVVMITGDHKLTAQAIAHDAGIFQPGNTVLTGTEIDVLSDQQLSAELATVSVFARVTPEHKLRIIQAYKARGEIIAMTGDGVNDAPSLVAADLGVAMGKVGTEVAKEAADIVLLDDNFGSIVSAVEEGRSIYKTIKKVILYLFSTGLGEVIAITGALLLDLPLPILAAHIIWLNFVTDGFLDVSLAMEPKEAGLLGKGYLRRHTRLLVDFLMGQRIVIMALTMGLGSLYMFSQYAGGDLVKARTITMTTLAVFQWFNAWNCRSETESLFKTNLFSNKYLVAATLVVILLQLAALYHPFMQKFLRTTGLSLTEWGMAILIALSVIVVEEIRKFFYRKWLARASAVGVYKS